MSQSLPKSTLLGRVNALTTKSFLCAQYLLAYNRPIDPRSVHTGGSNSCTLSVTRQSQTNRPHINHSIARSTATHTCKRRNMCIMKTSARHTNCILHMRSNLNCNYVYIVIILLVVVDNKMVPGNVSDISVAKVLHLPPHTCVAVRKSSHVT